VADETHRTASAPEAGTIDDSTRRTGAAPEAGAAPAPAPSGPASGPPLAPVPARTPGRIRRIVKRVLIVAAIVLVLNEVQVFRSSQALAEKLPRYGRSDVATVWANYQKLRNRSVLKLPTLPLAFRVERWLIGGADDITADYLSDTPTIREGGWREAAALLRRALEIAPGNGAARARLRYCEGHLARIDAEAMRERRAPEANGRFNTARRAFEDAARLRRGWPDPYLGLARVQAVGFGEVDRTRDALDRARRAGYQLGDRETAVEADAYATRADRTWRAVPGLPDEERYLERILDDCARSLELYESVPAYGTVRNAIKRVHALRDKVEMRLAALIAGSAVPETGAPGAAGQTPRP
jgi:hypothetical protein